MRRRRVCSRTSSSSSNDSDSTTSSSSGGSSNGRSKNPNRIQPFLCLKQVKKEGRRKKEGKKERRKVTLSVRPKNTWNRFFSGQNKPKPTFFGETPPLKNLSKSSSMIQDESPTLQLFQTFFRKPKARRPEAFFVWWPGPPRNKSEKRRKIIPRMR